MRGESVERRQDALTLRAELRKKHVDVHAVFPGPVDTEMSREHPGPEDERRGRARAIIEGVERGDEDILPDPMPTAVFAKWMASPKELERQVGSM